MPLWTSFAFVIFGLLLILVEVFVPAAGLIGIAGLVAIIGSVWITFSVHGTGAGAAVLLVAAIGTPIMLMMTLKLFPSSPVGKWLILRTSLGDPVPGDPSRPEDNQDWQGKKGIALSDLRPTGTARIGERKLSVVTSGEYIERDAPLIVMKHEGSRVVVRRVRDGDLADDESKLTPGSAE